MRVKSQDLVSVLFDKDDIALVKWAQKTTTMQAAFVT
jgi:hypothetical protein